MQFLITEGPDVLARAQTSSMAAGKSLLTPYNLGTQREVVLWQSTSGRAWRVVSVFANGEWNDIGFKKIGGG